MRRLLPLVLGAGSPFAAAEPVRHIVGEQFAGLASNKREGILAIRDKIAADPKLVSDPKNVAEMRNTRAKNGMDEKFCRK